MRKIFKYEFVLFLYVTLFLTVIEPMLDNPAAPIPVKPLIHHKAKTWHQAGVKPAVFRLR